MARTVFHQGAAEVAAREAPRLAQINHAIMNIDLWPRKLGEISSKTKSGGGLGPDLHEADFPNGADHSRVVAALDRNDGLGDLRGQPVHFGFLPDQRLVGFFGFCRLNLRRLGLRAVRCLIADCARCWNRSGRVFGPGRRAGSNYNEKSGAKDCRHTF